MLKKNLLTLAKAEPASLTPMEILERRLSDFEHRTEDFLRNPFATMMPLWTRMTTLGNESVSPAVDLFEDGKDIVVKAEIPGLSRKDIHVDIDAKTITISGEKLKEERVSRKGYYHLERTSGAFARTFALPAEVQTDKAKATFRDGVLEVRVPKTEEAARRSRKIEIE